MKLTPAGQYQAAMGTLKLETAQAWRLDDAGLDASAAWARVTAAADGADVLRRKYERSVKRKAMRASIEGARARAFWRAQS